MPIYRTRCFTIMLTSDTDVHIHVLDKGIGMAVKKSLKIIIKQVRLEGGLKRGGRMRVLECLRQIVPNRWANIRKRSFTQCFCIYMRGVRRAYYKLSDCFYIALLLDSQHTHCALVKCDSERVTTGWFWIPNEMVMYLLLQHCLVVTWLMWQWAFILLLADQHQKWSY